MFAPSQKAILLLTGIFLLLSGCSIAPPDVPLDDRAKLLNEDQKKQVRALQDKYRQNCKGAMAVITVDTFPRPEPAAYADEEFRNLKWPKWADSSAPKVLIIYSRTPELIQTRMSNRWLEVSEQISLQTNIAERAKPLLAQRQYKDALVEAADALTDRCPQPVVQGWVKTTFLDWFIYSWLDEAKDKIQDYAYPKAGWYSKWYYTLLFEPILNCFLLVLNYFNYSAWVIFIFPLILIICADKKIFEVFLYVPIHSIIVIWKLIMPGFVGRHYKNIRAVCDTFIRLFSKGFRWFIGLPSYAVHCTVFFWRPEDIITAQNHIYSWMPSEIFNHLPPHNSFFDIADLISSAGWKVGLIYFVAAGVKQAGEIAKLAKTMAKLEETPEEELNVVGKALKEGFENNYDQIFEEWLKQIWSLAALSIIIASAPLALTAYFIVKAIYDATGVIISAILGRMKLKVPLIIRFSPYVAVLVVLALAYSHLPAYATKEVVASASPTPQITTNNKKQPADLVATSPQAYQPSADISPGAIHSAEPGKGNLSIQVNSYDEIAQAQARIEQLKSSGVEARIVKAVMPNRGTWYRVQTGRFTTRKEAEQYGKQSQARGVIQEFTITEYGGAPGAPVKGVNIPLPKLEPTPTLPPKKITASSGVLQGLAIRKVQPPYPPIAKAARASGIVQVQVIISEEGRVIDAQVIDGHPLLRDAALQAARQWIFRPTELSGVPVKVQGVLTFNFALQ